MRWGGCAPRPPTIPKPRAGPRPRPSLPPPTRHEPEGAAPRRTGIAVADAHRPDRERDVRLGLAADAAADRQLAGAAAARAPVLPLLALAPRRTVAGVDRPAARQIGRASWRGRVCQVVLHYVVAGYIKQKTK